MKMSNATAALQLAEVSVPNTPQTLTPINIISMLRLQETVYEALSKGEKSFIVKKSSDTFYELTQPPHHAGGVFNESGELVGLTILAVCRNGKLDKRLTTSNAANLIARTHIDFGVIQCVLVHPDYRRHGLMNKLIDHHEKIARNLNLKALIAETDRDNKASEAGFNRRLFKFAGAGEDPSDGTLLNYWEKPLQIGPTP